MTLEPWRVHEVAAWEIHSNESRGIRTKSWVRAPDNSKWLRKQPREGRPYEIAIEATMARLARRVGIDAAQSDCCTWDGVRGIASLDFVPAGAELSSGDELIARYKLNYNAKARVEHTLELVHDCLEKAEKDDPGVKLILPFAHILAFDAWVGNGDRHQANWSVIRRKGATLRLAPMYDTAACLGAELKDDHALFQEPKVGRLAGYAERCRSGFGDGCKNVGVLQSTLLEQLKTWPSWTANVRGWVASFEAALEDVQEFFVSVPDNWLPQPRKKFALALLRARLDWLKGQLPHGAL